MRPKAIIMDLDGTTADSKHRHHFLTGERGFQDASAWRLETDKDTPIQWAVDLIYGFRAQGYEILYLTGREETCREGTEHWLVSHVSGSQHEKLFMRALGDNRADHLIKQEIYLKEILPKYKVMLAVDDRPGIAKLWRTLGVPCLHCDTWEEDQAKLQKIHETFEKEMEDRKK